MHFTGSCIALCHAQARHSISLQSPPLPPSCNLLGDVLSAVGDLRRAEGRGAEAVALYRQAIEQGYGAALRFSARDIRALAGAAGGWVGGTVLLRTTLSSLA